MRKIINFILSVITTILFLIWVVGFKMSFKAFWYSLGGIFLGLMKAFTEAEEEMNKGF